MRHEFQNYLLEIHQRLLNTEISPAEFTFFCLLPQLLQTKTGFQKSQLSRLDSQDLSSPMKFLKNHSWKGHSDRIRKSLLGWHQGRYALTLWHKIPSPFELLTLQAQGQRVITVFTEFSQWQSLHHGKSAWDFTVHDLIHADHFCDNPEWRQGQIAFYQMIHQNWEHPVIKSLRIDSPQAAQFEYLISDMNTHPQHLHQTFQALVLMNWKSQNGIDQKQRLPENLEMGFQKEMREWVTSNAKGIF